MILKELTIEDRNLVDGFLSRMPRSLSVYSFAQFAVWKGLYQIGWARVNESLCIFFKDRLGVFMNCEPLGPGASGQTVSAVFAFMDSVNSNPAYSRIENVEEPRLPFYLGLGYEAVAKAGDYVYERGALAGLRGDRYKSKRAACNFFAGEYRADFIPYEGRYRDECVELYDLWAKGRAARNPDSIYVGMLKDSRTCLICSLEEPLNLGLTGRLVLIGGRVRAFTFGYELNSDTFCVLFEVADLSFKGISQYIFRQLCAEITQYRFINAMDDSGLRGLRDVKRSYRPCAVIASYIVQRPHE